MSFIYFKTRRPVNFSFTSLKPVTASDTIVSMLNYVPGQTPNYYYYNYNYADC